MVASRGIPVSRIAREDVQGWLDDMVAQGIPRWAAKRHHRLFDGMKAVLHLRG